MTFCYITIPQKLLLGIFKMIYTGNAFIAYELIIKHFAIFKHESILQKTLKGNLKQQGLECLALLKKGELL